MPGDEPRTRRALLGPWQIVTILTLTGLGLRLLIVRGFWLDEATSGFDSRLSYTAMLHRLLHDNHPPLEYSILWAVAHTVGSSQTDLRLPSILFGTLTIPMLYLAGAALYERSVGLVAAIFGTVGALAVWYAQEARMYALFMLLATVTIWAQSRILQPHIAQRNRYWLIWMAASITMIWNQWFASLAVGTEILFFLWVIVHERHTQSPRRRLRTLALYAAGVVLACSPGIPLLLTQFRNNQANGLGFGSRSSGVILSPYGVLTNIFSGLFGYHSYGLTTAAVALWPLGLLCVLLALGRGRRWANRQLMILILLPMSIVFVASGLTTANRSLFEIRYFIEAVPALFLLLAAAAWNVSSRGSIRRLVVGGLIAALTAGLVLQQTDAANPNLYGYSAAFRQISSVAHPGDEILYAPSFLNVDVAYFDPQMPAYADSSRFPAVPLSNQIFVFGSFNFAGSAPAEKATLKLVTALSRVRHLDATFTAPNVIVWEFS